MARLEFLFDFGSPNAYYSMQVIPDIIERTGAELEIRPILLGGLFKITGNQAPWLAFDGIKGKMEYEMLESKRFMEKHGITKFTMNPHFPINTVTIMRGLVAAQELGVGDAYLQAVITAMWEEGLNVGDPAVVLDVVKAAGLDGDKIMEMIQTDAIKDKLKENTQAAADRGAFGVPTFLVGDELFFGKERLGQVEEELAKR